MHGKTPPWAIETQGLTRDFGSTTAVRGLDLRVRTGTVFGLLGPNGAGKTTTVRMLTTHLVPTGGTARVLGLDVVSQARRVRTLIGVTGQENGLDEEVDGRTGLMLLARLSGHRRAVARDRVESLLEVFDLTEAAGRAVRTYSGGMRRRLDIAASLLGSPRLLFLDEPTTGLDPRSRDQVWRMVRSLAEQGTTVLLTTQYLVEADQLADRVAVIDQGRVLAEGSPARLRADHGRPRLRLRLEERGHLEEARRVLAEHTDHAVVQDEDTLTATLTGEGPVARSGARALEALARARVSVGSFGLQPPELDEVFLSLTGSEEAA
ncbi:ATP-binding cassette domain-containing protein [Nocardiopsis sp. NPDC007018]|uniref:ATP-binding cassette domain-containing protein n=1 Tax=Nocardiopsis sp. NPDC007018 TaxID=3155721 RepID=UPI0033C70D32